MHSLVGHNFPEALLSITNKMQRYSIFFIAVNALQVSGGFSANHQELKTIHTACLLLPLAVAASKLDIYQMLCVRSIELLMMGGETA
jgi:hypothetical protein